MSQVGTSAGRAWLAAILFGAVVFTYADTRLLRATRPDMPAHFDLLTEDSGGNLIFRWNPAAQSLSPAENAELFIDDGPHHAQMLLSRGQIASGSIQYTPFTKDVRFRLVAHAPGEQGAQESIRVLGAEFGSADRAVPRHGTRPRPRDPGTVTLQVATTK
jgi:hypothetical protein